MQGSAACSFSQKSGQFPSGFHQAMALEEVQKVLTAEFLKILSFPGFFSEFLPGYRSICSFCTKFS